MASEHLFEDLEVFKTYTGDVSGSLISTFPLATQSGRKCAEAHLRTWGQKAVSSLVDLDWNKIQACEQHVEQIFVKRDERIEEFYSQVFVAGKLNAFAPILQCILFYMIWLLPIGSLLAPLALLLAPLVFMYIKGTQYQLSEYFNVIQGLLSEHSSVWSLGIKPSASVWFSRGIYLIGTFAVYISAFWAQWQTAERIKRVIQDIRDRVTHISIYIKSIIVGIRTAYTDALIKHIPEILTLNENTSDGVISSVFWKITQPECIACLKQIYDSVGSADVANMINILKKEECVCNVKWSNKTCIRLKDSYHPAINESKRITNDYIFTNKLHTIVTGPNRGGKSTMLKTIGINVLMAEAFGICYAKKARLCHFEHIETYINLTDRNGLQSLFETELARCVGYLERLKHVKSSLLIMDEIFHSTNPLDGIIAGQRFIKRLHGYEPTKHISIITTHYKELTEDAYNLCIESFENPETNKITYTYKVKHGTNFMSSVREILDEAGI